LTLSKALNDVGATNKSAKPWPVALHGYQSDWNRRKIILSLPPVTNSGT